MANNNCDRPLHQLSSTFGFASAVQEAQRSLSAANVEAASFPDAVAIVRLMGRNSGFVAAEASLASRAVDLCLIPEIRFSLDGPGGVLQYIEAVLDRQGKCVVVVAEGSGRDLVDCDTDIGQFLHEAVRRYFAAKGRDISRKYLDPTYQVRALPAIASDNILCTLLGHAAVHAAMAGMTACCVGLVHDRNVIIPLEELAGKQAKVDTVSFSSFTLPPRFCCWHYRASCTMMVYFIRFWLILFFLHTTSALDLAFNI